METLFALLLSFHHSAKHSIKQLIIVTAEEPCYRKFRFSRPDKPMEKRRERKKKEGRERNAYVPRIVRQRLRNKSNDPGDETRVMKVVHK